MCVSCGCQKYNDDHGDRRHITIDTLNSTASAAKIPVSQVFQNIAEAARGAAGQGQERAMAGAAAGRGGQQQQTGTAQQQQSYPGQRGGQPREPGQQQGGQQRDPEQQNPGQSPDQRP